MIHPVYEIDIVNNFNKDPISIEISDTWFRVEWYYQIQNPNPFQLEARLTKAMFCSLFIRKFKYISIGIYARHRSVRTCIIHSFRWLTELGMEHPKMPIVAGFQALKAWAHYMITSNIPTKKVENLE
jgi:hypothetical protein